MIQDIEPKHLYNEWKKNAVPKKSSAVVQFRGQDLLCRIDDNGLKFPSRSQFTEPDEAFTYLFELDGREYYLLFDENERVLDGYSYRNIGLFRTEKPKELAYAAVSAWHLCSWYRDARYCGRCGEKLVHDVNERMMRCPKCGNVIFPRINPSVIVAVTHGDYLLLTKYANRPGAQRTALVAGFTEFAESFEQTVRREVMEEVGLKVKDLRYYLGHQRQHHDGLLVQTRRRRRYDPSRQLRAGGRRVGQPRGAAGELYGQRHRPHLGDDRRICRRKRSL